MASRSTNPNVRPADIPVSADDAGSRTLRRGLQVLDAVLAAGREGLRVADLCRATGLERATVYRLLSTLVDSGYVAHRGASAMRPATGWRPRPPARASPTWPCGCSPCWSA